MFAFDLYDTDGSGELSPPEVLKLLQEIFGKEEMRTNIHAKRYVGELSALAPPSDGPLLIVLFLLYVL